MNELRSPQPPRLIDAPPTYSPVVHTAMNNVLRLFFNQLQAFTSALAGPRGAQYLSTLYAELSDDTGQTAAAPATAYFIDFPAAAPLLNGITLTGAPLTEITPSVSGLYAFDIALQVNNADAAIQTLSLWLVSDGVAVAGSNLQAAVPVGASVVRHSLMVTSDGTQVFQWAWSVTDTDVSLVATAAQVSPTRPATPAARALVRFVSAI
jgi:hypothetical protein